MDRVVENFLKRQLQVARQFTAASGIVKIAHVPMPGENPALPQHYVAEFACRGLVKQPDGSVTEADRFVVGIYFPDSYLRSANTFETLTWIGPLNVYHPNILPPLICVGERFMRPGTGLEAIIYQVHSVITYVRWSSHAGLNEEACQWARNNQNRFPVDRRPLKTRALNVRVQTGKEAANGAQ